MDQVFQAVPYRGNGFYHADYVFGRMMKLSVRIIGTSAVHIHDTGAPRPDYQSWCRQYPTYQSLLDAALQEQVN